MPPSTAPTATPAPETNGQTNNHEPATLDSVNPRALASLDTALDLPVAPSPPLFRWWFVGVGVVVLAGLCGAAFVWWPSTTSHEQEITAAVTKQNLDVFVSERGDLESAKSIQVNCEVEGEKSKIIEILPEGTRVTKGQ